MNSGMDKYKGKVAIVTGAGSGIGRALAEELSRRGTAVAVSDVNPDRLESTRSGIAASGGSVRAFALDVSDYEAVRKMVGDVIGEHGRLDYIFNNAGIAVGGEARDVDIEDWRAVLGVNLYGVVNGVASAYPFMAKQGWGHVVNTASIEGLIPFPMTASYVASKYAVVGLSNALHVEGADLGVKVHAVCPGYIKTNIFEDSKLIKVDREKFIKSLADWAGITPEECARRILKGVEKNKAIIPITAFSWIMWYLHRLSPGAILWLMKKLIWSARKDGTVG